MKILQYVYRKPNNLTLNDIDKIDSIALHHMDHLTATIDNITDWHIDDNNWDWIGYGYWVGKNGLVFECRGYKYLNSAVKDNNSHIVSIGFQGEYNSNNPMPRTQYDAGVQLIKYLLATLPKVTMVNGHKFWNDTSCPGKYFPLEKMIKEAMTMSAQEAILKLVSAGVIGSPDYWLKAIDIVKNLDVLLINMAKKLA